MRFLSYIPYKTALIAFTLISAKCIAQQGNVTVSQDPRFEQLLNEKRKLNSSITINDRYKVQVFYGDNEKARRALADFRRDFRNIDATIIYESPTYKVWAGNFKSRIDAERTLVEIKKKYPYALIIKPNK